MYCYSYDHFMRTLPKDTRCMFRMWANAGAETFDACMSDRQRTRVLESLAPLIPRSVHCHAVYYMDMRMSESLGDTRALLDAYQVSLDNVRVDWSAYATLMDGVALCASKPPSPCSPPPPPPASNPPMRALQASRRTAVVHQMLQRSSPIRTIMEHLCTTFPDINAEAHMRFLKSPRDTSALHRERVRTCAMVGIKHAKQRTVWYQYEYLLRVIHDHRQLVRNNQMYT